MQLCVEVWGCFEGCPILYSTSEYFNRAGMETIGAKPRQRLLFKVKSKRRAFR